MGMNAWRGEEVGRTWLLFSELPLVWKRAEPHCAAPQDIAWASGSHGGRIWLNLGKICASKSWPIIELAAQGDGASKLSIFGNVLAEPGWPSVMGIVEIFMYSVDAQNFVDDDNSSKCDYQLLSACEVPLKCQVLWQASLYPLSLILLHPQGR